MEYFQYTSYICYLLCLVDDHTGYTSDIRTDTVEILRFEKPTFTDDISIIILIGYSLLSYDLEKKCRLAYLSCPIEDDRFSFSIDLDDTLFQFSGYHNG